MQKFLNLIKSKLSGVALLAKTDRGKFWRSIAVAMTVFVSISFVMVIFFNGKDIFRKIANIIAPTEYAQAFSLVNDRISQGANIVVNVPAFTDVAELKSGLQFEPQIKGAWLDSGDAKKIVFKPSEELKIGNYFTAIASTSAGMIKKDFKIVDKPMIVSVFPKQGSEADEKSQITIIFNQAMVPLTSLENLEEKDIPVEITPATKGRFKWQGTRTLQFMPESGLVGSANYVIRVKSGFVSMDGLEVQGGEFRFTARHLRGGHEGSDYLIYDSPAKFRFNQPIDLEKTKAEIEVRASGTGDIIPVIAEYGKKVTIAKDGTKNEEEDRTLLSVYRAQDRFGRDHLWNFNEKFSVTIKRAFPAGGDIAMEAPLKSDFTVFAEMSSIFAESARTNNASLDVFDPAGNITVAFFEEVDYGKSEIFAPQLKEIKYGEKCKDESAEYPDCEKTDDRKILKIYFNADKIGKGEKFALDFKKVVNADGLTINKETISKSVTSFGVLSADIIAGERGIKDFDSLSRIVICSDNPLAALPREDLARNRIGNFITANNDFTVTLWDASILVRDKVKEEMICNNGQFESSLAVRLQPETDYAMKFKLADQFGQSVEREAAFRTGKMKDKFLNFYHFQKKYSITTPGKTVLTYAGENMDSVEMTICRLAPEKMLEYLAFAPSYADGPEKISGCLETVKKNIELPKKYWTMNYFKVDLKDHVNEPLGHYMITFSNPNYFDRTEEKNRVYERNCLTVTDLAVVSKQIGAADHDYEDKPNENALKNEQKAKVRNMYWISKLGSLAPVAGAQVDLYSKVSRDYESKAIRKVTSARTGANGVVETGITEQPFGVVVTSGRDSAIVSNVENKLLEAWDEAQNRQMTYLYTDRPIYRPSQTVYFKGIYRIGYDGDYEIFKDKKVKVAVYDIDNKPIFERELGISDYGTFSGEFVLPEKAALGSYRIEANGNAQYFDVEEYLPSAFKVEGKTGKAEYQNGEEFDLDIAASYYFGAPLEGGEMEYSVASQDYYFDKYKGDYFPFGSSWYSCWEDCYFGDKFLFRGQGKLDESGKAKITRKIALGDYFKPEERKSKIITIFYTVKNSSGQAVSGQQSFILHAGAYYLGVKADKNFVGKGESFRLSAKSVDTEGKELSVSKAKLKISLVEWKHNRRQEVDGGFYYHWERVLKTVKEENFNTDSLGNWTKDYSLDKEGEYEIEVSGTDEKGNAIISRNSMYVYGGDEVSVKTSNDSSLEIILDDDTLAVGDRGRAIIKSPFKKAKALISIERGRIYEYRIVDVDQNLFEYGFDVKEGHIPTAYISAVLLSDGPDLKYGNAAFSVDQKDKGLSIDIKPNKENYLPGEEVVLDIDAKNNSGAGVESEVSLAAADLSVLALKGNPKKNPVAYFYDYFPLTVFTSSNVKNVLFESDFYIVPGKGGGGVDPEDLARKKRGIFKDTAFWQADIRTGKDGKAQVRFNLPDNLTTWQAEAVGVTRDTRLGVGYEEFVVKKDVMAVPLKPRFVLPGDEFYIGVKIFNQTKEAQQLALSISSESLVIANRLLDMKIAAGESKNIYIDAKAPKDHYGAHKFTVTAKNDKYEDTVDSEIPVGDSEIYETFSTFGMTKDAGLREYAFLDGTVDKERGGVSITAGKTLSGYLPKALDQLLEYPYGCSEQIASKLEAIAIAKRYAGVYGDLTARTVNYNGKQYALQDAIDLAMTDVARSYVVGRGFSYYPGGEPDLYLTIKISSTLKILKEAGFKVNETIVNDLCSSAEHIFLDAGAYADKDSMNDAVVLAARSLGCNGKIVKYIKDLKNDKKYLNERASNISLATLASSLNDQRFGDNGTYRDSVLDILENRLEIDARGASLRPNQRMIWSYYENPIKDTAMLLKALTESERESETLGRMVNWLLRSRDKDGAWGTTDATAAVLDALSGYVSWQKELDAEFGVNIALNGAETANFEFNQNAGSDSLFLPMSSLRFGEMNDIFFKKTDRNGRANNLYYDMSLKYYLPAEKIAARDEGFVIERKLCALADRDCAEPLSSAKAGDILRGRLRIIVPKDRNFVAIEDFLPAGAELINENLSTEDQSLKGIEEENQFNDCQADPLSCADFFYEDDARLDRTMDLYPDREEKRDDRLFIFKQRLEAGIYEYDYYMRALIPGRFQHLPARISEMYFPENFGRAAGGYFTVSEK